MAQPLPASSPQPQPILELSDEAAALIAGTRARLSDAAQKTFDAELASMRSVCETAIAGNPGYLGALMLRNKRALVPLFMQAGIEKPDELAQNILIAHESAAKTQHQRINPTTGTAVKGH